VTEANRNKTGECAEVKKCVFFVNLAKNIDIFLAAISCVKSVEKTPDIFIISGEERYKSDKRIIRMSGKYFKSDRVSC
jgi:hypothetical protein